MTVETVDAVQVLGANVMAGTHDDGAVEVRIWSPRPHNPRAAAEEIGLLGEVA